MMSPSAKLSLKLVHILNGLEHTVRIKTHGIYADFSKPFYIFVSAINIMLESVRPDQ